MEPQNTCPDCGVEVGKPHTNECELQRCSVCGSNRRTCDCEGHDPLESAWTGEWPESMSKRDRKWMENLLRVKEMGIKNVPKGTYLHRWLLRQRRLYRQHLRQIAGQIEDVHEEWKGSEGGES